MADSARTQRRLISRASLLAVIFLVTVVVAAAYSLYDDRPQLSAAFLPVNYAPSVAPNRLPPAALEPEALLAKTFEQIGNKRMDNALIEIDKILGAYPNFRLAHLIRGDLLLARAHPISTLGNIIDAPQEQLDDLRDEARARVGRLHKERPTDRVPRYLLQMPPEQRHALVVDTAKSTLYVFENRNGEPHYVTDYYVTIGKKGMDKFREGDNKTPLGVYHVTSSISREQLNRRFGKLAEQYGVGALPINYPNEWDKRGGRDGHGIWLHGVPFDTYSRPPRASNGCVALTNEDFLTLTKSVQVGQTPVIIANGVEWANRADVQAARQDITQAIESWRNDWESLNTNNYLKHYSPRFSNGQQRFGAWAEHKYRVNAGKTFLKVKLENVSMFYYPGVNDLAVVTFDQDYNSNNLTGQWRKRQYWMKEPGGWKIVYEGAA